jgi:hypothetical protein
VRHRFVLLALLATAACADPSATGPSAAPSLSSHGEEHEGSDRAPHDLRVVRAQLLATDRAYAAAAGGVNIVQGLTAPLAPDGIFLSPAIPGFARGPAEAAAALSANPLNSGGHVSWFPIRGDVSSDGRQGYTYGYADFHFDNGAVLLAKYQAYWEKQANGAWKIAAYKRVGRGPGPVSATPPAGFETPDDKHGRDFPHSDRARTAAAVSAADVAFSDLAQVIAPADAFVRFAAPDGVQSGGAIEWAFGRDAIHALFDGTPVGAFNWRPEIADGAESGDLGFTVGFVYSPEGVKGGKYFTIWQRQKHGSWQYVAD